MENEKETPDPFADEGETTSVPNSEWLERSHHIHVDANDEQIYNDEDDETELIKDEDDVRRVLSLLEQQRRLRMNEKQQQALREARLFAHEHLFSNLPDHQHQGTYSEEEEDRVKDFDHNQRMEVLWMSRHKAVNYFLSVSFHVVVLLNFAYCVWESFSILVEDARFADLYLKDIYQCLKIVPSLDAVSHFVSIFHATSCVAVLHAKTPQTANLCWAFLFGVCLHVCYNVYEMLFNLRFQHDDSNRSTFFGYGIFQLIVGLIFQLLAVVVILQRYYDLTAKFQKRKHKFITLTYEGRQLNDRIIYRNVSSFVQRKYVLRSCTALQIYNTVQKVQVYKKKLKKGERVNEDVFNREARAACNALKEVEGFKGMDMMKELKRRHYENIKEEFEMGDPDVDIEEGNDERVEEIVEELNKLV